METKDLIVIGEASTVPVSRQMPLDAVYPC